MDVAIITRRLLLDFPQVLDITSQYYFNFYGTTYSSTNQMLPEGTYGRPGVDGLRLGLVKQPVFPFVATLVEKYAVLTVVLLAKEDKTILIIVFQPPMSSSTMFLTTSLLPLWWKRGGQYQSSSVEIFQWTGSKGLGSRQN